MTAALRVAIASVLASSVLAGAAFAQTGAPAGPARTAAVAAVLVFPTLVQGASPTPAQDGPRRPQAVEQPESGERLLHLAQHPRDSALPVRPRFIVQAVGYRAENETGADWTGSDEIYGIFFDSGRNIRVRTRTRGDVDTGETRDFDANQSCITPIDVLTRNSRGQPSTWACDDAGVRAPFSVHFSLYENDEELLDRRGLGCWNGSDPAVRPDCEDDMIVNAVVMFTERNLLASLPNVGASEGRTVTTRGYRFTYRITRVQNEPIVLPPRRPVLQGVQVHRSGTLSAALNQQFEFDSGAVVANNGDFAFNRLMLAHRLTPGGGARIWPGGATARGYAACAGGGANYVTNPVVVPPIGAHACYITNEGRVGEFRVDNLVGGTSLTLTYTTWQ